MYTGPMTVPYVDSSPCHRVSSACPSLPGRLGRRAVAASITGVHRAVTLPAAGAWPRPVSQIDLCTRTSHLRCIDA
jgi:hypothetical protein